MVQRGGRAGFAGEPLDAIGSGRMEGRQDLDDDVAAEPRIARPIDLAHAAGPQQAEDLIGTEASSGLEGHYLELRSQARQRITRPARAEASPFRSNPLRS